MTSRQVLPTVFAGLLLSSLSASAAQTKGISKAELSAIKGEVGIAMIDTTRNKKFAFNADKPFPMQSVCKLPVSIAVLRLADAGKLSVQDKVTVRRSDVLKIHSPIREAIKGKQTDFSIRELMTRSICDSDNTACDTLIKRAGGPSEVNRLLKEAGVQGVRVDRNEETMQPDSLKINTFLQDPRDTASPEAMVDLLQKLHGGNLLSKLSTTLIMEDLFNCKTGPKRLRAGLPKGWKLAHKTGTGKDVAGKNAGTNDVGVMVGPKGEIIFIAVFIKASKAGIDVREALMAKVASKAAAGTL